MDKLLRKLGLCSIENYKYFNELFNKEKLVNSSNFKVRKMPNDKGHYYISNGDDVYVLKNGNISIIFFHCYWESKVEAEIFLAGWRLLLPSPAVIIIKHHEVRWGACAPGVVQNKVEPYVFRAGDVCKSNAGDIRIIVNVDGTLKSFGIPATCVWSTRQIGFEKNGYKKIGELKDFIGD